MDVVYQLINFSTTNGLEFVALDNITKNTYSKCYVLLTCVFNYDARILQGFVSRIQYVSDTDTPQIRIHDVLRILNTY